MTLHGSNTSLASADQTLSGSETEDLVTPQTAQVMFSGVHWHLGSVMASLSRKLQWDISSINYI